MNRLANRVAVVTGAWRGIGAGIAKVLAENGARVILTEVSDAVEIERIESPRDGVISMVLAQPMAKPGDWVFGVSKILREVTS